ncbi:2-hydroxymuconate tautomerase [Alteribacillus iranensis]|uniref:Tautomerase n=1 Tax=Alteribacillus iranensis TaxID=930128 RepID=A0A1I2EAK6_9BACI|nr:2-hydroxymuconate tautomerase [Alteribacillus iranensis]SFE89626.1 4-oxalocrotonate isomerase [Alteribacillus iranensis]
MPIAHIHILEGRTTEQKKKLIEEVTGAIHSSIGADKSKIKILLHEIPEDDWATGGITKREENQ